MPLVHVPGNRVRIERESLDLSIHGLAALVGCSAATLCRYELGMHEPSYALQRQVQMRLFQLRRMVEAHPQVPIDMRRIDRLRDYLARLDKYRDQEEAALTRVEMEVAGEAGA